MELAYFLSALGFGFGCWCVGVKMGAHYTVKQITEELSK